MKITVKKSFKFAERGVDVIEYDVGPADVSPECAEIALAEKWAVKARGGAPENKASPTPAAAADQEDK